MGRTILWRVGSWTGLRWSGVPKMTSKYYDVKFVNNQDETTIMDSTILNLSDPKVFSKMVVDESGLMKRSLWKETRWVEYWSAPQELCDKYLNCGPNSYCDPYNVVIFKCKCFPGFEPKSSHDCMREKQGVSMCNNGEGFVKLEQMKVPDTSIAHVDLSLSMNECKQKCLRNCSCMAYASANESEGGIGCLTWQGDLVDTRTYPNQGQDLYIRVDAVVLGTLASFIFKILEKHFRTRFIYMCGCNCIRYLFIFYLKNFGKKFYDNTQWLLLPHLVARSPIR